MPELQAQVINIHGIAPIAPNPSDSSWRTDPDFKPLDDFELRFSAAGKSASGTFSEQDADFREWFERQKNPVWAGISAKLKRGGTLPIRGASYVRTVNPPWPHQGFYTQLVTVHRRFVQVEGSATFPAYDSEYTTPIFVARLALNGGRNQQYSRIGANLAQLVQPVRKSKSQHTVHYI